jgi:hypothetical protein
MKISNKVYDVLCIIAKIVAPVCTLIAAILTIWHIPYTKEITATLAAFDVFIGSLVTVFKIQYDKNK